MEIKISERQCDICKFEIHRASLVASHLKCNNHLNRSFERKKCEMGILIKNLNDNYSHFVSPEYFQFKADDSKKKNGKKVKQNKPQKIEHFRTQILVINLWKIENSM